MRILGQKGVGDVEWQDKIARRKMVRDESYYGPEIRGDPGMRRRKGDDRIRRAIARAISGDTTEGHRECSMND